jgi:hypothetical protein
MEVTLAAIRLWVCLFFLHSGIAETELNFLNVKELKTKILNFVQDENSTSIDQFKALASVFTKHLLEENKKRHRRQVEKVKLTKYDPSGSFLVDLVHEFDMRQLIIFLEPTICKLKNNRRQCIILKYFYC